jgi:transmembrane protein TMEM260 (protein O-mannosyltransferase)
MQPSQLDEHPRMTIIARRFAPFAVAAVALTVIRPTLMPGVGFWDTAEFQTLGPVMGTGHSPGYPTYAILGWLASVVLSPFGDPAFRMNLFSALCVAAAAGVTAVLVRRLTGWTVLGIAAGLGLATTPLAWRLGTHAEGHTLHLLFLAVLFLLLVTWQRERAAGRGDRLLLVASVVFGVSVANHSLTLLLALPIAAYVLAVDPAMLRRYRFVAACLLTVVATTALVYLELPLRAGPFRAPLVYGTPHTWDGFWYVTLAEQFRGAFTDPFADLGAKFAVLVERTVTEFGWLSGLIPLGFLATVIRARPYALLSGLALFGTVFFAASYINADITRYYLGPAFIAWTWLAILGAAVIDGGRALARRWIDGRVGRDGLAARVSFPAIGALLVAAVLLLQTAVDLPARARQVDESKDVAAQQWLAATLGAMEPNAVVVSWWSYSTSLWYAQHVEGRRPDIRIVDDRTRLDEHLGEVTDVVETALAQGLPTYVIRADSRELATLADRYELERVGPADGSLMRVLPEALAAGSLP